MLVVVCIIFIHELLNVCSQNFISVRTKWLLKGEELVATSVIVCLGKIKEVGHGIGSFFIFLYDAVRVYI